MSGLSSTKVIRAFDVGEVGVRFLGEGEPLLFLHGGEGPAPDEFLAALAPGLVIAPDLPGFGGTPLPGQWNEMADLADFAADVLDGFGLDRAHVVGHSFGGYVAATLATRAPSRVDRLVLSAPIGIQVPAIVLPNVFALGPDRTAALLGYPAPEGSVPLRLVEREALARFLFARPFDRRLLGRLPRVERPSLVLRGSDDRYLPAAYVRAFADALGAPYRELADLPHAMPALAPAELAKAIRTFLDEEQS